MQAQKWPLIIMQILLGWFMVADGWLILQNPNWSAANFLLNAKTFTEFYAWFAEASNLWWVNPLNSWGIFLIGVALVLGVFARPAAWAGALMMILYYFPHYAYPFYVQYGWIVEEHIIYAAAFVVIALSTATKNWGIGPLLRKTPLGRLPVIGSWL